MEVTYEREDEELIGADLQTRRRRFESQQPIKSHNSTSSDSSTLTSDSSFEYSASMDNNTTISVTNGENHNIIEGKFVAEEDTVEVLSEVDEEEPNNRENNDINVAQNGDNNGFNVKQNGDGVVEYSSPDINGGDEETDTGLNTSSFSKSPEIAVGLKYVESLLDEGSNGVNDTPFETYNTENIVNKTLIVNGQNEIVETGHTQEVEPEVEGFDVERVIQNQETHDLFCPNCHSCITKRVILKRRKRKIQDISKDESVAQKDGKLTPMNPDEVPEIDEREPENELPRDEIGPDARLDAISCFSCFSIFVPKGDGFLCWRFKPKQAVLLQPGDASTESTDPVETEIDGGRGTTFPLWILTCCQPYHTEKPVPKPEPRLPPISDDGAAVPPLNSELSSPPSHDTPIPHKGQPTIILDDTDLPPSTGPAEDILLAPEPLPPVTSEGGKDFPLWFLTCCQPSDKVKPEHSSTATEVPTHETNSPSAPSDDIPVLPTQSPAVLESAISSYDSAVSKDPLTPIDPSDEIKLPLKQKVLEISDEGPKVPPHESERPPPPSQNISISTAQSFKTPTYDADVPVLPEHKPLVTPGAVAETGFPLWFLTCCQPSMDESRSKPSKEPGTGVLHHEREPPAAPSDGQLLSTKPISPINPGDDILSPPEPEAPRTPPNEEVIVPLPDATKLQPSVTQRDPSESRPSLDVIVPISDEPMPQPSVTHPDASGSGPSLGIKQSLLEHPLELPRPGVSGLDIIKAIVYGGLLECITSLSVITSAAGGDATTLNIVALGLANVFGGLIVLLHSLRVLKHEQATERYEDQLGRPGHYVLHAIVAILSYLVFGLLSPVIYGFSFRKSDNKDYKLATLAAASLACITILSIAKAYVRRPPKSYLKTIFYYVVMGFMVSGVGYVAGDLINMLLKKLGVFDPKAPVTMMPVLEAGAMKGPWSSY
ncbi:uncharacterized protein LOC104888095 isoform X4 [Beta vulgaris subsp. vulgaris]|uniref:uncharacterized protein LOC104888095 isoform X4 n=1 Tax=Beta vulgaris subsp. vulgaris TaxID=3555 RepID=UPI0025478701|nr:uncharacterized protein LOC104888095 isoform X4 [Beta vulgaris subsp. vulgaris]